MLKQNSNKHANQECVTCIQALMVHVFLNQFFFIHDIWQFCLNNGNGNFKYLKMKAEIKMKSS